MSTTKRTTPAPERATARVLELDHLFRVSDGNLSAELQIDVPYLCGEWGPPVEGLEVVDRMGTTTGELIALTQRTDCPACVAVYTVRRAGL